MFADIYMPFENNANWMNMNSVEVSLFQHYSVSKVQSATINPSNIPMSGRVISPLSSHLSTGVDKGILLSADALIHTTSTLSASEIHGGFAKPSTTFATALGGGLGGVLIPTDPPIGVEGPEVSVGNGVLILFVLALMYALFFAIKNKETEE